MTKITDETTGTKAKQERSVDDVLHERVDGVAVSKMLDRYDDHSTVLFVVESDRDESIRLVLEDRLPPSVSAGRIGFNPEYRGERWTLEDDRVVFEDELEPGGRIVTLYGVKLTDADRLRSFLRPPTVDVESAAVADSGEVANGTVPCSEEPATVDGETDVHESEDASLDTLGFEPAINRLVTAVERQEEALARQARAIDDLERRLEAVAETVENELGGLEEEVVELRGIVEEGAAWRTEVSRSFSGATNADAVQTDGGTDPAPPTADGGE